MNAQWTHIRKSRRPLGPATIFQPCDEFGRQAWFATLPVQVPAWLASRLSYETQLIVRDVPRSATQAGLTGVALKAGVKVTLMRSSETHEPLMVVQADDAETACMVVSAIDADAAIGLHEQVEAGKMQIEELEPVAVRLSKVNVSGAIFGAQGGGR